MVAVWVAVEQRVVMSVKRGAANGKRELLLGVKK